MSCARAENDSKQLQSLETHGERCAERIESERHALVATTTSTTSTAAVAAMTATGFKLMPVVREISNGKDVRRTQRRPQQTKKSYAKRYF